MSASDYSNIDASCKVWVADLPAGVTHTDLTLHFSQVETAVGAHIVGPGVGMVVYQTASEAASAISSYNGSMFLGHTIQVSIYSDDKLKGGGKGGGDKGKGGGKDDGWGKGGGKDDWSKGGGKDDWSKGGGKDDGWGKGGGKDDGWGKGGGKDDWNKGGGKDDWSKGGGKDDSWGKGGGKDDGWGKGGGKDDWSKGGGKDDWSKGGGKDDWNKGGGKDDGWGKDGKGGGKDSWGKDGKGGKDDGKGKGGKDGAPPVTALAIPGLPPGPDGAPNPMAAMMAAAAAAAAAGAAGGKGEKGAEAPNPMAFMMGMMDGMASAGGKGTKGIDPAMMQGMMAGMMGGMQGMKLETGGKSNVMVDAHGKKWDLNEWELQPNGKWKSKISYAAKAPTGVWQDWSSDASQTHWVDYSKQEPYDGNPKVIKITLPTDSPIVSQGFPPEAPSVSYIKGNELFSSASHILQEIVGDLSTMVKIEHDTDFTQFPDVARAVKEAGGDKDCCIAVGVCPEAAKWAVGIGAGYKGREFAVKLSLAVALAGADAEIVGTLAKTYPGFEKLCAQMYAGTSTASQLTKLGVNTAVSGGLMENPAYVPFLGPSPGVHLLQLTAASKLVAEGLPGEGPAIVWDKDMKDTFSCSHLLLSELCDAAKVDFRDDTEWTVLPDVGAAITAAGAEHNCFCVAIAPNKTCWGVGVANGWKGRQPAAKLALSLAMAMHAGKLDELSIRYPEFGAMCAQAGLVELNAAKRAKVSGGPAGGAPGAPCLD